MITLSIYKLTINAISFSSKEINLRELRSVVCTLSVEKVVDKFENGIIKAYYEFGSFVHTEFIFTSY